MGEKVLWFLLAIVIGLAITFFVQKARGKGMQSKSKRKE